jgi:DNA-binding helix-hairpin-helix protein with protein kinase domain
VYHKRPLPDEQVAKLQAMVSCWSAALESISAWPRTLLFDSIARKPWGILMNKMSGARPLHELYGTTNRRRHFPEAGWHHMVLAARNTAAAFQTLHSAGIVVGDVNQGNMLVDKGMTVRLIDCDSFQITSGGRTFFCPVGTPHFTPPELQSLRLREVPRSVNHDRFGLAVLIFHLLFVGRHPFAGRYRGPNDLPIEKAIAERRFAFSKNQAETLVDPPPASLLLDDLPPAVAELFEVAFRGRDGDIDSRPTPVQWVEQLELLMKQRRTCTFDQMHIYYSQLTACPWCRIEDAGGPSFFVAAGGITTISADRLSALDERIWDLQEVKFADLSPDQLTLPEMPPLKRLKLAPKKTRVDYAGPLLVLCWLVCVVAAVNPNGILPVLAGRIVLGTAAAFSLFLAGYLLFGKESRERRKRVKDHTGWLERNRIALQQRAQFIEHQHRQREYAFTRATEDLNREVNNFRAEGDKLQDVIVQHREGQKGDFLRGFLIRENANSISGLTNSQITIMESYGVESANDVDRLRLSGIPSIDEEAMMELLQWRTHVERGFKFNPEHGVTIAELRQQKDAAVRRFKISQARRILTAGKQLESLAETGKLELSRTLANFDQMTAAWAEQAKSYRDFQSGRQRFERLINRSPWTIIGLSLALPAVAMLLHLLFAQ